MVKAAYVKLWGQIVGAAAWNEDKQLAIFEYAKDFNPQQMPISPIKMPNREPYSFPELKGNSTFNGLPGLLADSLPDKYGNDLINVWLAQNGRPENSLNPIELLCFIGTRGMGALEFEPSVAPMVKSQNMELQGLIAYTQKLLQQKENLLVHTDTAVRDVMLDVLKMGTSAGGARPKAIIAFNEKTGSIRSGQTLPGKNYAHWLIKFDGLLDTQFGATHGYGRVEMAYYNMATDFGINMMESRLIEENHRAHFMTKRFDRVNGDEKLHVQTFCGLQHFDYQRISSYAYEQLFQTMRQLKLTYAEAEQMFKRMVFNVLARNCDDHTKNFSFTMQKNGQWKLAPAYDICHSFRSNSTWVSQHCLSINGKRNNIERNDLLEVAKQNSIRMPEKVVDECLKIVNKWRLYAEKYSVEEKLIDAIDKTLIKDL